MLPKHCILTKHAKERMGERKISEEEIELVLRDADTTHPGLRGDMNMIKTINNRKIKVAYIMEGKIKKIITVMVLS